MRKLNDLKQRRIEMCTGREHGRFVDPSEPDNEPTDQTEGGEFFDYISNCQPLKNKAPRSN
jgi:hypothetical protein